MEIPSRYLRALLNRNRHLNVHEENYRTKAERHQENNRAHVAASADERAVGRACLSLSEAVVPRNRVLTQMHAGYPATR